MKPRLRFAMAGAGFASELHLAGCKRVPNAEVIALCDPNAEKAAAITLDLATGYGDSYAAAIARFASALSSGAAFETSPDDNLQTLALVEGAYALARPLQPI